MFINISFFLFYRFGSGLGKLKGNFYFLLLIFYLFFVNFFNNETFIYASFLSFLDSEKIKGNFITIRYEILTLIYFSNEILIRNSCNNRSTHRNLRFLNMKIGQFLAKLAEIFTEKT